MCRSPFAPVVLQNIHSIADRYVQASCDMQVVTYTSDLRGAGSDGTIFAQLVGTNGSSPRCNLVPADRSASSFSRGQQDVFQLHLPELGPLQALTIGKWITLPNIVAGFASTVIYQRFTLTVNNPNITQFQHSQALLMLVRVELLPSFSQQLR